MAAAALVEVVTTNKEMPSTRSTSSLVSRNWFPAPAGRLRRPSGVQKKRTFLTQFLGDLWHHGCDARSNVADKRFLSAHPDPNERHHDPARLRRGS